MKFRKVCGIVFSSTKTKLAFLYFTIGLDFDFEINLKQFIANLAISAEVINPYINHNP